MSNEPTGWDIILVVRTLMSSFPAVGQQPTPILDLREDVPNNQHGFWGFFRTSALSFVFTLGIGLMIAILARADDFSLQSEVLSTSFDFGKLDIIVFFAMLLSTLLAVIAIHELGHLLAGKAVGLTILGMQVGPILFSKNSGKFRVSFQKRRSMDGFAFVGFDSIRRISRRFRVFIAGGPLASLLSVLLAYVLARSGLLGGFALTWTMWFGFLSTIVFVVNLVPFQMMSGFFSDGARLKMLFFPSTSTHRWIALIALRLQMSSGRRLRFLNRRWLALATKLNDNSREELTGTFYAYLCANDSEDVPAAAAYLERCLQLSAEIGNKQLQNLLFLEASVFHAWFRNSTENCLKWRNRVRNLKAFPWFIVLRADTALLWAQGDVSKAINNCEEAISKCDTLPPAVNRERFREGWKEWIEKMQERGVGTPA